MDLGGCLFPGSNSIPQFEVSAQIGSFGVVWGSFQEGARLVGFRLGLFDTLFGVQLKAHHLGRVPYLEGF